MEPFPPIFAYVIFFILDFIAFILDITVVASIAGVFLSFLSTFLYVLWVFFRYGPGKAAEKIFNLKNKTGKKLMKLFGGAVIPFVNVWAVYDDYREETGHASGGGLFGFLNNIKSKKGDDSKSEAEIEKEMYSGATGSDSASGYIERDSQVINKGLQSIKQYFNNLQNILSSRNVNSANSVLNSANTTLSIMNKSKADAEKYFKEIAQPYASTREQMKNIENDIQEAGSLVSNMSSLIELSRMDIQKSSSTDNSNSYNYSFGREIAKQKSKMTIQEEIGGVKTGLNKEDYDSGIKNYGDFDTYTKENKENEENKRQKQEEARKNDEAKRIQGIKADQDLRTEMLDTAKRRYGENSDEAKRGKEEEDSNHSNDDYREII